MDDPLARCISKQLSVWDERGRKHEPPDAIAGYPEFTYAGRADDVAAKLELAPTTTLLDAGAGPGALALRLVDRCSHVVALDLALVNLLHIDPRPGRLSRVLASIHALPLVDETFDAVLCYGVLHYFPSWEHAERVIRELIRVCKPGGKLLLGDNEPLVDTSGETPVIKQPVNVAAYDPETTYLCFDHAFFESVMAETGCHGSFPDTWKCPGNFDVLMRRESCGASSR